MNDNPTERALEAASDAICNHEARVDRRADLVEAVRRAVAQEFQRPQVARIADDLGPELSPSETLLATALAGLPGDRIRAIFTEATARGSLKLLDLELALYELKGDLWVAIPQTLHHSRLQEPDPSRQEPMRGPRLARLA